jgi:hypothetical protein
MSSICRFTHIIFVCGSGEDTVTDFNEAEGDIATPDCENINP